MRMPRVRFTVRGMMVAVAIAALDVAVVRAFLIPEPRGSVRYDMMVTVGLPMANLTAIASLVGFRQSGVLRRFLVGFVVFGGIATAAHIAWVGLSIHSFVLCWRPILMPIAAALRRWPTIRWPILWTFLLYAASMAVLLAPQLLLAGLGGLLTSGRWEQRRQARADPPMPE